MLREYPGLDVLDFHRGLMTPRRLAVLINGLPPTSATRYAMEHPDDPDDRRWDDATYLLNHMSNVAQQHLRISWTGHGLKGQAPQLSPLLPPEEREPYERKRQAKLERRDVQLAKLKEIRRNSGARKATPLRKTDLDNLNRMRLGARSATPPTPELEAAMREAAERRRAAR